MFESLLSITKKHYHKVICAGIAQITMLNVQAGVSITEVMPSNISTIVSDQFDYNGYVELYNDGEQINLQGWTISNSKDGKEGWTSTLKQTHIIPQGYSLLFFGKKETSSNEANRINRQFAGSVPEKLNADAATLTLTNGNQKISISYPKQYPHVSYGVSNGQTGYMMPTPGKDNTTAMAIDARVNTPVFTGTKPGLYLSGNTATITLATTTDGASIYYTTNGDIPTPTNGTLYTTPFTVNKSTIVRARAYKDGMLYSGVTTGSFLYTENIYAGCGESKLPIVSISSDVKNLYGDSLGLCVKGVNGAPSECTSDMTGNANYNQDWTRPANFEYFVNGEEVDNQEVEIGIFGGCSRSHEVKSFKIKANKRSGNNKFQYTKFFNDRNYTKYKSLAIRNGGNGWYLYPRWRDGYFQSLAKSMNIDYQAYQPVGYFLNGEYKGLMGLRERTDEDYINQIYGYDEDEIEYLRVIKTEGYVAQIGNGDAYNAMERFAQEHNQDADFYEKLAEKMDIDEYIDYQIIQQFIGNTDWVNNNTKVWRKKDGGKFRWILFDTDFGMSQHTNVNNNMLLFCTTGNASDNTQGQGGLGGWGGGFGGFGGWGGGTSTVDQKFCTLFKGCMANEDFKYHFLDRYTYLLKNYFNSERTAAVLDSLKQLTAEEVCAMIHQNGLGGGSQQQYESGIESMRNFAKQRPDIIEKQLVKYYEVQTNKSKVNVTMDFGGANPKYSYLVNKIKQENTAYQRELFTNERIRIEIYTPAGFQISDWSINGQSQGTTTSDWTGKVTANTMDITIKFVPEQQYQAPKLYINEVCSSNGNTEDEYGNKPDWIEVYNDEDHSVDLAGMVLENATSGLKSTIPYGSSSTVIPAKGHVILWADKEPETGPLHLGFKLSATIAQNIKISQSYMGNEQTIDAMTYELHDRNGSYGRQSDGSSSLMTFYDCIEGNNGKAIPTPETANGTQICHNSEDEIVETDNHIAIYPNPTNNSWTLDFDGEYTICNALGQTIAKGKSVAGQQIGNDYPVGLYIIHVAGKTQKLVKN